MNNNNFLGRLTRDPEVLEGVTSDNKPYKRFQFTIAVDRKMSKDAKEKAKAENKPTADYPSFKMFVTGDNSIAYWTERLKKGVMVEVSKAIYRTESYTDKDGKKQYAQYFEINTFDGSELIYLYMPQQTTQGDQPQTPAQPPQQQTAPPAQAPQQAAPQQTAPPVQNPSPNDIGGAAEKLPWD